MTDRRDSAETFVNSDAASRLTFNDNVSVATATVATDLAELASALPSSTGPIDLSGMTLVEGMTKVKNEYDRMLAAVSRLQASYGTIEFDDDVDQTIADVLIKVGHFSKANDRQAQHLSSQKPQDSGPTEVALAQDVTQAWRKLNAQLGYAKATWTSCLEAFADREELVGSTSTRWRQARDRAWDNWYEDQGEDSGRRSLRQRLFSSRRSRRT